LPFYVIEILAENRGREATFDARKIAMNPIEFALQLIEFRRRDIVALGADLWNELLHAPVESLKIVREGDRAFVLMFEDAGEELVVGPKRSEPI
jgi:hypothetical protein